MQNFSLSKKRTGAHFVHGEKSWINNWLYTEDTECLIDADLSQYVYIIHLTQYVECAFIGVRCCASEQARFDNIIQGSCTGTRDIMWPSQWGEAIQMDMDKRLKWINLGGNYNITL